jgi:hypothetical protein
MFSPEYLVNLHSEQWKYDFKIYAIFNVSTITNLLKSLYILNLVLFSSCNTKLAISHCLEPLLWRWKVTAYSKPTCHCTLPLPNKLMQYTILLNAVIPDFGASQASVWKYLHFIWEIFCFLHITKIIFAKSACIFLQNFLLQGWRKINYIGHHTERKIKLS